MTRNDLIFRVFVSSTFNDLIEERNALQAPGQTFDNLRKYCQERGARFQAIDLRWGVNQEAQLDQQAMNICLQELGRCQEVSPKPNFIVLLGNRYGWRPLPARIEAREFEEILAQMDASGMASAADKALLCGDCAIPPWRDGQRNARAGWCRKDLNAAPVEYVLQPRAIEFPDNASDDDCQRIRKEEANDWHKMEDHLRRILLAAINQWSADDPRRFKYEASATHQEIQAGALKADDPQSHVFCYFRDIDGLPADSSAAHFRDFSDGAVDADAQRRLDALKAELCGDGRHAGLLPLAHAHRYHAVWRNGRPEYDQLDHGLEVLWRDVERDLKEVIDREIAAFQHQPALERERAAHEEFARERRRHFAGRRDLLDRIQAYIDSDDNCPLVIHGVSGCGKTAVIAQAVVECGTRGLGDGTRCSGSGARGLGLGARGSGNGDQGSEPGAHSTKHDARNTNHEVKVIARFVGATPGSSDLRTLMGDLLQEAGMAEIPQDMNDLVRAFRGRFSAEPSGGKKEVPQPQSAEQDEDEEPQTQPRPVDKNNENAPQPQPQAQAQSAEQGRLIVFLDALDQLNPTENARMLYWMPRELKPNVKFIVSVLQSKPQEPRTDPRLPTSENGKPKTENYFPETEKPNPENNEPKTENRKPKTENRTPSPENRKPETGNHPPDDPFDLARRIWPQSLVEVGPLDETSAAQLLDAWLGDAGRKLQDDQRQEVLAKFAGCPLPLYLKLAMQEACRWKSWEGVPAPLAVTVEEILAQLLARLERPENHGPTLVSRALGYIAAAKNGLTEDELLDVLSRKESGVLDDFLERSPESPRPIDRLPVIVWSRLFADIQPYMTRRRADGTVVSDFYHRQVGEAVRARYLSAADALAQAHLHLADYFHTLDYWAESLEAQRARAKRLPPTPRPANVRKVVELPYHRLEAAKLAGKDNPTSPYWNAVADLLTDWQFLEAKAEADPNFREQESHETSSSPTEPASATEEAKP